MSPYGLAGGFDDDQDPVLQRMDEERRAEEAARRVQQRTQGPEENTQPASLPYEHSNYQPPQAPTQEAPGPPPAPPIPPPVDWTQADTLELQRHNASEAAVRKELGNNVITQQQAAPTLARIQQAKAPLLQRQEQFQAQLKQKTVKEALEGAATAESIRTVHQGYRAQEFPKTVASFTDPITGATTHFTQDDKGNFKEMEFGHHNATQDRYLQAAANDPLADLYGTPQPGQQPPAQVMAGPGVSGGDTPEPASLEQMKQQSAATGKPMSLDDYANFEQTIQQGGTTRKYRGGVQISGPPEPEWEPVRNGAGRVIGMRIRGTGSDDDLVRQAYAAADRQVPQLPYSASPEQIAHRNDLVNRTALVHLGHLHNQKMALQTIKARLEQHDLDLAAQKEMAQMRLDANKKFRGMDREHATKVWMDIESSTRKEAMTLRAADAKAKAAKAAKAAQEGGEAWKSALGEAVGAAVPKWYDTNEGIDAESDRRWERYSGRFAANKPPTAQGQPRTEGKVDVKPFENVPYDRLPKAQRDAVDTFNKIQEAIKNKPGNILEDERAKVLKDFQEAQTLLARHGSDKTMPPEDEKRYKAAVDQAESFLKAKPREGTPGGPGADQMPPDTILGALQHGIS